MRARAAPQRRARDAGRRDRRDEPGAQQPDQRRVQFDPDGVQQQHRVAGAQPVRAQRRRGARAGRIELGVRQRALRRGVDEREALRVHGGARDEDLDDVHDSSLARTA